MFSRPFLTPQSGIGSNHPWWWREGQFQKFCTDMDDCLQILHCTKTLLFFEMIHTIWKLLFFYLVLYHNNNNNNNNINIILKYATKSTWKVRQFWFHIFLQKYFGSRFKIQFQFHFNRTSQHYQVRWILTLRRLMSHIYGAPILDVSRSHTTTQRSR